MPTYRTTYRGEFDNVLADGNNVPLTQTIRIDIGDVKSGVSNAGDTITADLLIAGFSSAAMVFELSEVGGYTVDEINAAAAFFTNSQFKKIRVTGTTGGTSDGDYTITNDPAVVTGTSLGSYFVTINLEVNDVRGPGGDPGTNGVTIEDISEPAFIDLAMTGDPLHISVIDNNEDKFTPIRAKQATINIYTGNGLDINTFCEGDDGRWYVEVFVDDLIVFRGFLIVPDMQQDFQPDPNVLTLTATDNLGILKDVALVEFDNTNPINENAIIMYIAWALNKTNIHQNINVVNNLKAGTGSFTVTGSFTYSGDNTVFTVANADAVKFVVGQQITISGTASNNVTVTVTAITAIDAFNKKIVTNGTFSTEGPVAFTVTDTASASPFYQAVFLNAKTFEDQIGTCVNCYETLKRILTEDCVLFQSKGEYYIIRVDEIEDYLGTFQMSVDTFDYQGNYLSTALKTFSKAVGINETMWWCNDDAIVIPDRPYQHVRETFKYETPSEIICNIDFSRGDFIADLTPTAQEQADGAVFAKSFNLNDWTMNRGWPGSPIANDSTDYIYRLYNVVNYESGRFAVITKPSSANVLAPYIVSCDLPVNKLDRFEANINYKLATNPTSGGGFYHLMVFVLHGSDGSWWILDISEANGGQTGHIAEWKDTANWTLFTGDGEFGLNFAVGTDYSKFQNLSYDFKDVPPLPIAGKLQVWLFGMNTSGSAFDDVDIHYSGLSFTYWPFINGSYQKYTGQYNQVSQTTGSAIRENQVYIEDSPAILYKGSLLLFNGIDYVLASVFTDHNHSTPTPYGQIRAFAVWNQYRQSARNFEGNVDFIDSDTTLGGEYDGIDLLHKVDLTDADASTNNRYFMTLHYDMDYYLLTWKAFIASVQKTKVYTDTFEFKYITT